MEVFDFLVSKGVVFRDAAPGNLPAEGNLTPRRTGMMPSFNDIKDNINNTAGSGIIRPLERAARAAGVDILLQHRMVRIVREHPTSGRVLGIVARDLARDRVVNIAARRGVRRDFRCATDNGSDFSLGGVRSDESRSAAPRRPSRELKCGWITTPPTPTSTVRRGSTCPVAATRAASAGLAITPS
jgi:hypothetical protein